MGTKIPKKQNQTEYFREYYQRPEVKERNRIRNQKKRDMLNDNKKVYTV